MQTLDNLTTAIQQRIQAVLDAVNGQPGFAGLDSVSVLVADAADLQEALDEAVDKFGMLVLVNMPSFKNEDILSQQINGKISLAVEVGEVPTVWRDNPLTKPTAKSLAQLIARALQQFFIPGFQPIRVLDGNFSRDKARQVYSISIETMQIFDAV